MSDIRVAPDGAIFDRVAEFAFEENLERARTLFSADPSGYTDALGKFVQTLAASEKLVGGATLGVTSPAPILKERLKRAGRLDYSEFFNPEPTAKEKRLADARAWLLGYWDTICEELNKRDSAARTAIAGHLKREAYYRWVLQHPAWFERLAIPDEEVLRLPMGTLNWLVWIVRGFLADNGVSIEDDQIKLWVRQNLTIHFRNFAEYWNFVGETTGAEYMPAYTRSSIFLGMIPSPHPSIVQVVMPFVGFRAIQKVRNRGELVERVLEWGDSKGRRVVEDLLLLQGFARRGADEQERQKSMEEVRKDVEAILRAPFPRKRTIELNLAKPGTSEAEKWLERAQSKSYRWLWRYRDPDLEREWRRRIEKLLR